MHCQQPRTAGRPHSGGRPAARFWYRVSIGLRYVRQGQQETLYRLAPSFSVFARCFPTAGGSTTRHSTGRRSTVECGVARLRVLLRGNAQQRPPDSHFQPVERFVDRRIIRQIVPIKIEGVADLRHVCQPIRRFTVAVAVFESKTVENDVLPAGEPASGGLARVLPQCLFG